MKKNTNVAQKQEPFYVEFISGWFAGCGRILSGQPFDIVKTRLQTQSTTNPIYSGAGDCFKRIMKNEGFHTFYKGTATPLAVVGSVSAIHFTTFKNTRELLGVS